MSNESLLYHIHTLGTPYDPLWKPGSTFTVKQGERNHFLRYCDTATIGIHHPNGPTIPISQAINKYQEAPEKLWHQHCRTLLQQAGKAVKEMGMYIREVIFEEIRRNQFSDLPSRLSCIWLCDAAGITHWWPRLRSDNKIILKTRVVGTFHRANPAFLIADSIGHDELRSLARKYWSGETVRNEPSEELLFCGQIHVLHQYNDLAAFMDRGAQERDYR